MVFQLIYASELSEKLRLGDVELVLEASQKNNPAMNVTGLLFFSIPYFIQLLEGDEQDVRNLYEKVKQDERHRKVRIIKEQHVDNRLFDGWSMAYINDSDKVRAWVEKEFPTVLADPFSNAGTDFFEGLQKFL